MSEFTQNVADEAQVKSAENRIKYNKNREVEDFKSVMESVSGRRLIYKYISECGVFEDCFTGATNTICYNEGKRSIGLRILSDCDKVPDLYFKMIKESKLE